MVSEIFCPNCNHRNADTALVCSSCGTALDGNETQRVAIPEYTVGQGNVPAKDASAFIDDPLIPKDGVGIYIAGAPHPYYLSIDKELILGRRAGAAMDALLDLSNLNAMNMGVSRQHAMIRQLEFGYEVIDLASRNGTWLNSELLIPNQPYPFASGSELRLGRMELFIVYHAVVKGTHKE